MSKKDKKRLMQFFTRLAEKFPNHVFDYAPDPDGRFKFHRPVIFRKLRPGEKPYSSETNEAPSSEPPSSRVQGG